MIEYVTRFLNMIVAGLLAHAARLTKVAAARHEVAEYMAVLEEADLLEQMRRSGEAPACEIAAPGGRADNRDGLHGGPAAACAVMADANHHPFALPRPTDAAASQAEGEGLPAAPPPGPPFVEGERGEADGGRRANAAAAAGGGADRPDSIAQSHSGSSHLTRSETSMGRKRLLTSDPERDGPAPRASPAPRRTALGALRGPRDAGPRPPRQAAQSRATHSLHFTC